MMKIANDLVYFLCFWLILAFAYWKISDIDRYVSENTISEVYSSSRINEILHEKFELGDMEGLSNFINEIRQCSLERKSTRLYYLCIVSLIVVNFITSLIFFSLGRKSKKLL